MSEDIKKNAIDKLKKSEFFALQVDESTDISGKAQFLAFIHFVDVGSIIEIFLCCKELPETTKDKDVSETLIAYLGSYDLSWNSCIGIYTDGAP